MAAFDHGIKMIAKTASRQLARLAGIEARRWQPLESTLQTTTEMLADRVFRAQQGQERFVVYFEFYSTWDRNAPWDMLAKSGLLSQREKLPTLCVAIVLRLQRFRSVGGQLRLEAAGGPTQQLWFKEVRVWEQQPASWWEDEPALMALYPLCQHGRQPRESITHAACVIESKVAAIGERGTFLTLLALFGKMGYPRLDVLGIIGRKKMKESKFYQEILEEGALATKRAYLLKAVRGRFGKGFEAEVANTINTMDDLPRLEQLFDAIVLEGISADVFRIRLSAVEGDN
jgi:hypothetical protein